MIIKKFETINCVNKTGFKNEVSVALSKIYK